MLLLLLCSLPLFGALNILHLTDIHLDPYYRPGSSVFSFCHRSPLMDNNGEETCGEFGAHGCDSPLWLLEAVLYQISTNQDMPIDAIIITGDNSRRDHDDKMPRDAGEIYWANEHVYGTLRHHLPEASNKIFFSIGNNDVSMHDSLDCEGPDLPALASAWQIKEKSFMDFGFYSAPLTKNISIVSINTLLWSPNNKYARSCHHEKSPGLLQLRWLRSCFKDAEKTSKALIIIGHLPESFYFPSCRKLWNKLLYRFRSAVKFQTFGHIHQDIIDFSSFKGAPSVPLLSAPGLSPYTNRPAFRILQLNNSNGALNGIKQYNAPEMPDSNHFELEYDTKSGLLGKYFGDGITIPQIASLKRQSLCSSFTRLMLQRYQNVCY